VEGTRKVFDSVIQNVKLYLEW